MATLKIQNKKAKEENVAQNKKPPIIQSKLVKSKEPIAKAVPTNIVYATGRRKTAVARVRIMNGNGKIIVNKKNIEQYFKLESHMQFLLQPFIITKTSEQYNVICSVNGGGMSGQVGAIRHGISRALDKAVPELHTILRKAGLLTRDSRVVERKKYGKHKARKSTQFSKR